MPSDKEQTPEEWFEKKLTLHYVKNALKLSGFSGLKEGLTVLGWLSFLHGDTPFRENNSATKRVDECAESGLFSSEREEIKRAANDLHPSDRDNLLKMYDEYIAKVKP